MKQNVYSVYSLVHYLKQTLDNDMNIQSILVKGEISNFTNHRSGHWYFTLKDAKAKLSCVMFSSYASRCKIPIKEGMKVIITASLSMYEAGGSLQLYVNQIQSDGIGDLYLQYEQLKQKLAQEGYFDSNHKKLLPIYPMNIGIISAKEGAAIQDMLTTISRRWPLSKVTFYPSLVQGNNAAKNMVENLLCADVAGHDVILLARGGGAIEDLWCFNDETLAKTIYSMNTVVVSGVGHESDTTLVDYVSDARAPTPTAAAEMITPDIQDVISNIQIFKRRMTQGVKIQLQESSKHFHVTKENRYLKDPMRLIDSKQLKLAMIVKDLSQVEIMSNNLSHRLNQITQSILYQGERIQHKNKQELFDINRNIKENIEKIKVNESVSLKHQIELLDAYSPLKILKRGYSIAKRENKIIKSIDDVQTHDRLEILIHDGVLHAEVIDKKYKAS